MSDNERWEAWHRQQITAILNLVAATERQSGQHTEIEPLQFERIVNEEGEPGGGFNKASKIVSDRPWFGHIGRRFN